MQNGVGSVAAKINKKPENLLNSLLQASKIPIAIWSQVYGTTLLICFYSLADVFNPVRNSLIYLFIFKGCVLGIALGISEMHRCRCPTLSDASAIGPPSQHCGEF